MQRNNNPGGAGVYVNVTWEEVSAMLGNQYTCIQIAEAMNITVDRLRKNGLLVPAQQEVPADVMNDPRLFCTFFRRAPAQRRPNHLPRRL